MQVRVNGLISEVQEGIELIRLLADLEYSCDGVVIEYNEEIIAFWRNEEKVIKYIPEYVFATWREIKNKYHIEVFRDLDSVDGIKACDTEMLIVLFMLEDNSVKVITREDFYGK